MEEVQANLKEVLDFLQNVIHTSNKVVETFKNDKVDKCAVSVMTSEELQELGLYAKGDQAKLRAFCRKQDVTGESEREAKMRKLLKEIVQQGKSTRTSPKPSQKKESASVPPRKPKPTLKFEFRWKHSTEGSEYKLKRAQHGGGVRAKAISREAGPETCLKEAQDLFFPGGKNSEGKLEDLKVELADFKDDIINISDSFSAEGYKEMYGLHTPRLVLLSSKKKEVQLVSSSPEYSSDEEFMSPPWLISTAKHPLPESIPSDGLSEPNDCALDYQGPSDSHEGLTRHSSLIGTSDERKELVDQIQRDYEASLANDKAKEQQRGIEEQVTARREDLRIARERRTPPEPDMKDPHIIISVRHPDLGSVLRAFSPVSKLLDVYNWVGSLAILPEHFFLTRAVPRSNLYPDEDISSVGSSVLYMLIQDYPIPLSQDLRVNRSNITVSIQEGSSNTEDTLGVQEQPSQLTDGVKISHELPKQVMEEDKILSYEEERALQLMERLQTRRQNVQAELPDHASTEVSRSDCLKDLLALYKQDEIMQSRVHLAFKEELAVGNGVSREVYAVFWENFVTHYCEGVVQFVFGISPSFTLEDYVTLGRILTHQFIQTGTMPLQLSEAIVQQAVVGSVSKECLLQSFFMLLHEKERDIIQKAILGTQPFPTDELIDILCDYGTVALPNPSNIGQIVSQVANMELITKQFACIVKLREGMGSFWDGVSAEEIKAIYSCCSPTFSKVASSLYFEASTPQEEKVSRWLVRYLKNQTRKILSRFMRFCTGSELVRPHKSIKVVMEIMPDLGMRPKSRTCFGILTLPKNHQSYTSFSENLDFYMHNPHVWDLSDI